MKPVSQRKAQLEARLAELTARLGRIEGELGGAHSADSEDAAQEHEADEVLEGMGAAGLQEVRQIEAALERIATGQYGTCMVCGAEVAAARLDLLPWTPFCRDHAG